MRTMIVLNCDLCDDYEDYDYLLLTFLYFSGESPLHAATTLLSCAGLAVATQADSYLSELGLSRLRDDGIKYKFLGR